MEEYLFKKAVDLAFGRLSETLRKTNADLTVTTDDMESALNHHIRDVKNWSSEVSFSDLRSAKQTSDIYIPLDVFVYPRRRRISPDDSIGLVPFEKIFEDPQLKHLVILGHPGAGKTTSMKHLCHRLLYDADFLPDRFTCPLLIRLRDLNVRRRQEGAETKGTDDIIIPRLEEILGLRIRYPADLLKKKNANQRKAVRSRIVTETVDSLNILIILDGFDEIVFKKDREAVIEEFRFLTNILERSVVVVTARTGEFNYHVPKASQFEICPLTDAQVRSFASRWLGAEDGSLLYSEIMRSPFADTAIRPLTLAHLCAIFERTGKKIPEKPKTVYRKIVNLLLEEWDQQRSVKRESSYAGFEVDRKFEFLSHLAYALTTAVKGSVFGRQELIEAYARIHDNFGLPRGDASKVADELETHTGLFIQAGYERFEFSHRSLQEYLAAEFIVKLPSIPDDPRLLLRIPNELAVATAISSSPSEYFSELVCHRLQTARLTFDFARTFVSRLLLEKPDFDRSSRVGAGLLALYSLYLESVSREGQMALFVIDRLLPEFRELGNLIKDRIQADLLLDVFDIRERAEGLDGKPVLRLRRRKLANAQLWSKTDPRSMLATALPPEIWVREDLLGERGAPGSEKHLK